MLIIDVIADWFICNRWMYDARDYTTFWKIVGRDCWIRVDLYEDNLEICKFAKRLSLAEIRKAPTSNGYDILNIKYQEPRLFEMIEEYVNN